jgi:hypothetical protein
MTHLLGTTHRNDSQRAGWLPSLAKPAIAVLLLATCVVACVDDDVAILSALPRGAVQVPGAYQLPIERFDHSVAALQSTPHDSDAPGASIAAYDN